jgi:hypothetical protein
MTFNLELRSLKSYSTNFRPAWLTHLLQPLLVSALSTILCDMAHRAANADVEDRPFLIRKPQAAKRKPVMPS